VQNWRAAYINDIFLTSNISLCVLSQTSTAKREMMECLVSLIGLAKLAKCFMSLLGLNVEEQPHRRAQGVGKELIKHAVG
jgi:hypothetical protein